MKIKSGLFAKLAAALIIASLGSCASQIKPKEEPFAINYLKEPMFDMKGFFNGNLEGFGVIHDKDGKIIATEKLEIKGKWRDKKGLIEKNYSGDSTKEDSTWLVDLKEDGGFSVIGHGFTGSFEGKQVGNSARIKYSTTATNKEGAKIDQQIIENYYMVDENSVIGTVENFSDNLLNSRETLSFKKILASIPVATTSTTKTKE